MTLRSQSRSLVLLGSGGVSALVPISALVAATTIYPVAFAGVFALMLSVVAFIGQMASAVEVEARVNTKDPGLRIQTWVVSAAIGGAALAGLGLAVEWLGALGLAVALSVLDTSRLTSLVNGRILVEAIASATIGTASVLAIVQPSALTLWALLPGAAATAVTLRWAGSLRFANAIRQPFNTRWILAETAVTGLTMPVLNAAILGMIGPTGSICFRMISSVTNLFSPALSFLRVRLLHRHSRADIAISALVTAGVVPLILVPEVFGVWDAIFGDAWATVTLWALTVAILWKLVTFISTIAFAGLRRDSQARRTFALRLLSTVTYITLGLMAAYVWKDVTYVFCAFAVAETVAALLYWRAATKGGSRLA